MHLNFTTLKGLFKEANSLWPGKAKWVVVLLAVLGSLLELAGVAVLFRLLLYVIESGNNALLVAAGSLVFFLLKNLALHKIHLIRNRRLQELYGRHSERLYEYYFSKGFSFIKEQGASPLSHNVNYVCYTFVFGYVNAIISLIGDYLLILLIFAVLFQVNPIAAVAEIVIFVPMVVLFTGFTSQRLRRVGREDNIAKRKQWKIATESFRGYPDIVVGNAFGEFKRAFKSGIEQISRNRLYAERLKSISGRSVEIGLVAVIAGFIVVSAVVYPGKPLSEFLIPVAAIFTAATLKLLPTIRSVLSNINTLENTSFALDIILAGREEPLCEEGTLECVEFESLELRDVNFSFSDGREVLKGFSLKVGKGERVGIRGLSGSGKSTLLLLILGIYKPESGQVLLNGVDLGLYNLRSWHKLTGYVSQETFLLDATLARNITFETDLMTSQVQEAIRMVSLEDFVLNIDCANSWKPGEGGGMLSGGEKQRLAIARVLYKSADLLLLDEATSALDSETELKIIEILTGLQKTIIIVSHREKMLEICNKIIEVVPITA